MTIVGIATVEVCGLTIKGVTVKQGQDGLFEPAPILQRERRVSGCDTANFEANPGSNHGGSIAGI